MNKNNYSDEIVNAFVDDELGHQERIELIEAASKSDHLRQRICDAQLLKELVVGSYPKLKTEKQAPYKLSPAIAVAASIVFFTVFSLFTFLPSQQAGNIPVLSASLNQ